MRWQMKHWILFLRVSGNWRASKASLSILPGKELEKGKILKRFIGCIALLIWQWRKLVRPWSPWGISKVSTWIFPGNIFHCGSIERRLGLKKSRTLGCQIWARASKDLLLYSVSVLTWGSKHFSGIKRGFSYEKWNSCEKITDTGMRSLSRNLARLPSLRNLHFDFRR